MLPAWRHAPIQVADRAGIRVLHQIAEVVEHRRQTLDATDDHRHVGLGRGEVLPQQVEHQLEDVHHLGAELVASSWVKLRE